MIPGVERQIVCSLLANAITGRRVEKLVKDRDEAERKRAEADKKNAGPKR